MDVLDMVNGEWGKITIEGYSLDVAIRIQQEYVCSKCHEVMSLSLVNSRFKSYEVVCEKHGNGKVSRYWLEKRLEESEREYNEVERNLGTLILNPTFRTFTGLKNNIFEREYPTNG